MKQLARNIYNNIRGGINGLKSTLLRDLYQVFQVKLSEIFSFDGVA